MLAAVRTGSRNLSFLYINALQSFQVAPGWCNQPVVFVDSGKAVHDRPFLLARFAIPEAHTVAQFVRYEPLQRMRIGCGKIEIDPGGEQHPAFLRTQWIEKGIVPPVILVDISPRNRETTPTVHQTCCFAGVC